MAKRLSDKYFSFEGEDAGKFTWNFEDSGDGLTDPDGISEKTPDEVLKLLFAETTSKKRRCFVLDTGRRCR